MENQLTFRRYYNEDYGLIDIVVEDPENRNPVQLSQIFPHQVRDVIQMGEDIVAIIMLGKVEETEIG